MNDQPNFKTLKMIFESYKHQGDIGEAARQLCGALNLMASATGLHKKGLFGPVPAQFHLECYRANYYLIKSNMQTSRGTSEKLQIGVNEFEYELWTTSLTRGVNPSKKDAITEVILIAGSEAVRAGWEMTYPILEIISHENLAPLHRALRSGEILKKVNVNHDTAHFSEPTTNYLSSEPAIESGDNRSVKTQPATMNPPLRKDGSSTQQNKLSENMATLESMIGLDSVKEEIRQLVDFSIYNKKRIEQGLKPVKLSLHLVFTGNPGTGKTTVARLIGEIYTSLGLLKKGHVVETDKSHLVGDYLGQSLGKTKKVIEKALDGVLFIDEAYSLTENTDDLYGREAVDTILKEMEDKRDRLAVIVAGYPEKMAHFISSNPGLESRFTTVIDFEDYAPKELKEIFSLFAEKEGLKLSPLAEDKVIKLCQTMYDTRDFNFGNGRTVRNVFERVVKNLAKRVAAGGSDLGTIEAQDIPDRIESSLRPSSEILKAARQAAFGAAGQKPAAQGASPA